VKNRNGESVHIGQRNEIQVLAEIERRGDFHNVRRTTERDRVAGIKWDIVGSDSQGRVVFWECKASVDESQQSAARRTDNHKKFSGDEAKYTRWCNRNPHAPRARLIYVISHEMKYGLPSMWAEDLDDLEAEGRIELWVVRFDENNIVKSVDGQATLFGDAA
jgi:hypothetical protein